MSIIIKSLTYIHPDKSPLFENLSLVVNKGQKAALVGNNGAGKSTLLKLAAGKLLPFAGEISYSERPWYIPQHLGQYDHLTIAEALEVEMPSPFIERYGL